LEEAHDVVLLDRLAALNFTEKERTAHQTWKFGLPFSAQPSMA
jgi:hypothetical protein